MSDIYECPTCHHTSQLHWHRLTPGVVKGLIKLREAISEYDRNCIDIHHEMELTTSEAMNWTKLRFHGLVAKYKEDGQVVRGKWVLTKRGNLFLTGKLAVPSKVQTLNNHLTGEKSTEVVSFSGVMKMRPWFESIDTIESERLPV